MPLLIAEREGLKARLKHLKRQAKRLDYLYELIEWGGLSSKQWVELHELEFELGLINEKPFGCCTYISLRKGGQQ